MCEYPSWATSFTIWTVTHFFYSFFIQYVVIGKLYYAFVTIALFYTAFRCGSGGRGAAVRAFKHIGLLRRRKILWWNSYDAIVIAKARVNIKPAVST